MNATTCSPARILVLVKVKLSLIAFVLAAVTHGAPGENTEAEPPGNVTTEKRWVTTAAPALVSTSMYRTLYLPMGKKTKGKA